MKKFLLSFAVLFAANIVLGNAGVFRGGGETPKMEKSAEIQMVEEEVVMMPMRGNYPVGTNAVNLDPMMFRCSFLLRNLSDKEVTVPVGFPLSTEAVSFRKPDEINQTELIALFGFVAGTKERSYPVRFVPYDKGRKFSNLFLWEMTFAPREEIRLFVSYTMGGYYGMGSTLKKPYDWKKKYRCNYLTPLCRGITEGHVYVTGTGGCWAGKIEKAVFKLYLNDFEEYLDKRGAFEIPNRKKAKREGKDEELLSSFHHRIRTLVPAEGWVEKSDKNGRVQWLELTCPSFEPKEKDTISLSYTFTEIPYDKNGFETMLCGIRGFVANLNENAELMKKQQPARYEKDKTYFDSCKPFDDSVVRNLADTILEFYGIRTGNGDIQDFLDDQVWYPVKKPAAIDPKFKEYLQQKTIPFPETAWQQILEKKKIKEEDRKRRMEEFRKRAEADKAKQKNVLPEGKKTE